MARQPRYVGVTNRDRARWAEIALRYYQVETGSEDEDAIADLIGDLMHLARHRRLDPHEQAERGRYHFGEEEAGR
jgi:hypothetical protein